MRTAEVATLVPLGEAHIEAIHAVAMEHHRVARRLVEGVAPLELFGRLEDDGLRIEFDRLTCARERTDESRNSKTEAAWKSDHCSLPRRRHMRRVCAGTKGCPAWVGAYR